MTEESPNKWQREGIIIVAVSALGMAICAYLENIYFELFFGFVFVVSAIAVRIDMERQLMEEKND